MKPFFFANSLALSLERVLSVPVNKIVLFFELFLTSIFLIFKKSIISIASLLFLSSLKKFMNDFTALTPKPSILDKSVIKFLDFINSLKESLDWKNWAKSSELFSPTYLSPSENM